MMSVHDALEAWQHGEIDVEQARQLTGAFDVYAMYELAKACGVEIGKPEDAEDDPEM